MGRKSPNQRCQSIREFKALTPTSHVASSCHHPQLDFWGKRCSSFYVGSLTPLHAHTHPFNGPFPGLPGSADTKKVKPIWILLKQETVSGSGISWDICKSATRSRQITTPAPHHSVFYKPDAFPPPNQQRQSTDATALNIILIVELFTVIYI